VLCPGKFGDFPVTLILNCMFKSDTSHLVRPVIRYFDVNREDMRKLSSIRCSRRVRLTAVSWGVNLRK